MAFATLVVPLGAIELRLIEGANAIQTAGARASTAVTVLATDDTGKPLAGVTIGLRLPDTGATGVFPNGLRTEILLTREDGRATIHGIQWNALPGTVQLRITAAKGADRAGTVATLQLLLPLGAAASRVAIDESSAVPVYKPPSRWSSKWTIITLAAVGAVGGGFAARVFQKGSSAAPVGGAPGPGSSTTRGVLVGPPIISITPP